MLVKSGERTTTGIGRSVGGMTLGSVIGAIIAYKMRAMATDAVSRRHVNVRNRLAFSFHRSRGRRSARPCVPLGRDDFGRDVL
jgi:hypothetical protein